MDANRQQQHLTELIANYLFKANGEYGFYRLAKEDAEKLISILETHGFKINFYESKQE